jgi:hypothetical protein
MSGSPCQPSALRFIARGACTVTLIIRKVNTHRSAVASVPDRVPPVAAGRAALRHLLVGFDGSQAARRAVRQSAAATVGLRLTVVFVETPPGWLGGLYLAGLAMARTAGPALDAPDCIVESMRREISGLPARLSVTSLVRSGRVVNGLARAARLTGATAIVLGTGSWQPAGIGEGGYGRLAWQANVPAIEIGSRRRAAGDRSVLRATVARPDAPADVVGPSAAGR